MDLPTYTNIWRIEKRLYKLYDFRLPMPLPISWIAVFCGITVPYVVVLAAIGVPFDHNLFFLYVLPPGVLTWLSTRPVLENKRLPELLDRSSATWVSRAPGPVWCPWPRKTRSTSTPRSGTVSPSSPRSQPWPRPARPSTAKTSPRWPGPAERAGTWNVPCAAGAAAPPLACPAWVLAGPPVPRPSRATPARRAGPARASGRRPVRPPERPRRAPRPAPERAPAPPSPFGPGPARTGRAG